MSYAIGRLSFLVILLFVNFPLLSARAVPKMVKPTNAAGFQAGIGPLPPSAFVRRTVDGRLRSLPALMPTSTKTSWSFPFSSAEFVFLTDNIISCFSQRSHSQTIDSFGTARVSILFSFFFSSFGQLITLWAAS